jgi:hypothetical protein
MRRTELLKLLNERPIAHPTTLESLDAVAGSLRMTFVGYKWWEPAPGDGRIVFVFEGLSEGSVDISFFNAVNFDWDEALEDFHIQPLALAEWALPATESIYCSTALKDPLSLYAELHDYLSGAGSYLRPEQFLNCGGSLKKFSAITASHSYMIARGSASVCEVVRRELDRQRVTYNIITTNLPPENRLWVEFGDADFLCEAAFAEFD